MVVEVDLDDLEELEPMVAEGLHGVRREWIEQGDVELGRSRVAGSDRKSVV